MASHSTTLAWKIPWMEKPGRLQSMVSQRVRHDWATSLSLFIFIHWRRKWQPTPVFLPGESQGRGSLVGCCLWGRTESDTTELTWQQRRIFSSGVDLFPFPWGQFLESWQLMSWLQSGHHVVNFFLLVRVLVSVRQLRGHSSEYYLQLLRRN